MKKLNLKNIIWKEGKHYVGQCLNVDVSSFGNTKKEALKNLDEAIELYFEGTDKIDFTKVVRPEIIALSVKYA
ncbi:MAG: type II toxin-antitoxin system HicB family antitoxin [bacterium]